MQTPSISIDVSEVLFHLGHLSLAFILALPVAWNREQEERTLGLRTFPLVALASAGYVLMARSVLLDTDISAQARIIQGLMTGIGFLGGGAIVKQGLTVHGAATAASIWSTAAVGAAVAYTRYEIAVVLALANFLVLRSLHSLKEAVSEDTTD